MLEYMRKNANSKIVWLIIGAIAIVFIFFGVGGSGGGNRQNMTVNGEEINPYQYSRMVESLTRNFGGESRPEDTRLIREYAIQELAMMTLIRQFATAMGLPPSDEAVGRYIASTPEFQTNGRFDKSLYEAELASARMNAVYFEGKTREEMLNNRLSSLITSLSQVFPPEQKEVFHFQFDQAAFDYVFFPAEKHVPGLTPTDQALEAFYAQFQDRWRQPAGMVIEYVELRPADFLDEVTISDEEMMEYYENNKQRFEQPESVTVSQILIKYPSMNPGPEEKSQTLARAEAAYERAKTEDFAALAAEISEDPLSAPQGGQMGRIVRGLTGFEDFEETAFNLPLGEVSRPVATDIGYHLLKVNEKTEMGVRPFEEVKDTLEGEQKAAKAREAAVAKLEDLITRTETNPKLSEAAATMGLTAQKSQYFTEADAPAFFENDPNELRKAFSAPLNRVGPAVERDDIMALYTPLERRESRIPPLEEIKTEVTAAWVEHESALMAQAEAESFIEKASTDGWSAASQGPAADGSALFGQIDLTARGGLLGRPPFENVDPASFASAIYSVAVVGQVSPVAFSGQNAGQAGAFALALKAFEPADELLLASQVGQNLAQMLTLVRTQQMSLAWRQELIADPKNKILVPASYRQ